MSIFVSDGLGEYCVVCDVVVGEKNGKETHGRRLETGSTDQPREKAVLDPWHGSSDFHRPIQSGNSGPASSFYFATILPGRTAAVTSVGASYVESPTNARWGIAKNSGKVGSLVFRSTRSDTTVCMRFFAHLLYLCEKTRDSGRLWQQESRDEIFFSKLVLERGTSMAGSPKGRKPTDRLRPNLY